MNYKRLLKWLPSLLILSAVSYGLWQKENLWEWWRNRNYQPSSQIVALADATTMSGDARRLFFAYRPELDDRKNFGNHCSNLGEQTIVLGCYVHWQAIYVYDVEDARLNGVHEVTAAHELLHAAYDRLSSSEREHINKLITDYFASITDQRIKDTVESYRKKDASVVPNELHSILGTEVRTLPAELETYYRRYFNDRKKIVDYSERYESTFTNLKAQVAAIDGKLADLKKQIDINEASLDQLSNEIELSKAQLEALKNSGNISAYNVGVAPFNAKVNNYNRLATATRGLINEYNSLIEQRNQLAVEQEQLINALDSHIKTQTEQ